MDESIYLFSLLFQNVVNGGVINSLTLILFTLINKFNQMLSTIIKLIFASVTKQLLSWNNCSLEVNYSDVFKNNPNIASCITI